MPIHRVSVNVADMVQDALERLAGSDTVYWDVGPLFSPQQPPTYYVSLTMPSALIGHVTHAGIMMQEAHMVTQEQIDQTVGGALEQLRNAVSAELQQGLQQAPQVMAADKILRG